tara:strand:- start:2276 stop:2716 length:441 start_codon:yes stop_codon:yes gene_type:complete
MASLRHVGITVCNIQKSTDFYQNMLGFDIVSNKIEQGEYIDNFSNLLNVIVRIVKMRDSNNNMIELLEYQNHQLNSNEISKKINVPRISHIAFTVTNLNELYHRWTESGIKFICKPQGPPEGKAIAAFCRDPEGNLLELVEELQSE